jgi:hypothetical protein
MAAHKAPRPQAPAGPAGFLRGHQVARVLAVAVPLAMFLVWWGIWGTHGDLISEREVSAVVLSDEGKTCLVRVDSGQEVRIIKPRNVIAGMRLRMRRSEYDNGELRFDLIGRELADADAGATGQ